MNPIRARNGYGKLYARDPHTRTNWNDGHSADSFEIMEDNLDLIGVKDTVDIVRKYSHGAAEGRSLPIDRLFIVFYHSYECDKRDWTLFSPHVSPTGVVVSHDAAWGQKSLRHLTREDRGVPRFLDELRGAGYPIITLMNDAGYSLVQPRIGGIPLLPEATALPEATPVG